MRDRGLTTDEQVLARATKGGVQAAGGLDICERETGKSDSQLSRCCSTSLPDSISIRDAVIIDAIGVGKAGHPHILRAQARILGFLCVPQPSIPGSDDRLLKTVAEMMAELGDVATEVADALRDDGECDAREARRILIQLDEHDTVSARLRAELNAIVAKEGK
jgi:hypothetical protein